MAGSDAQLRASTHVLEPFLKMFELPSTMRSTQPSMRAEARRTSDAAMSTVTITNLKKKNFENNKLKERAALNFLTHTTTGAQTVAEIR